MNLGFQSQVLSIDTYPVPVYRWLGSDNMRRQSQYHSDLYELRANEVCKLLLENTHFLG